MSSAGKEGGRVAALYIRVSTLDQAREGYSLAAQQAALEAWAAQKSYATQLYADEGISGKDIDHRPAMRQILADVEAGKIAVVAVWALSRLTRSVADLYATWELLAAHGVGLVSHTEGFDTGSPTGRAMYFLARLPGSTLMLPVPFARFLCLRGVRSCFLPQAGQYSAPSGSSFLHLIQISIGVPPRFRPLALVCQGAYFCVHSACSCRKYLSRTAISSSA